MVTIRILVMFFSYGVCTQHTFVVFLNRVITKIGLPEPPPLCSSFRGTHWTFESSGIYSLCSGLCSCWHFTGARVSHWRESYRNPNLKEGEQGLQNLFRSFSSSAFSYFSPPLAFWLIDAVISTTIQHSFCSFYYVCFFQMKNGDGRIKSLCQKHSKSHECNWEGVGFSRDTLSRTHPCSYFSFHKDSTHVPPLL